MYIDVLTTFLLAEIIASRRSEKTFFSITVPQKPTTMFDPPDVEPVPELTDLT